jgi:hypothetical protein
MKLYWAMFLLWLGDMLTFACHHRRYSFPMRMRSKHGKTSTDHVSCLDCGARLPYDWNGKMRVMNSYRERVLRQWSEHADSDAQLAGNSDRPTVGVPTLS